MAEIWPPSRCLHSPDTEEDEEGQEERGRLGERITCSCSAVTQSPPRLRASGHGDNILWLTLGPGVAFMRGICVHCVWMREGQIEETYITCLRPTCLRLAFVSVHSNRTFTSLKSSTATCAVGLMMWCVSV